MVCDIETIWRFVEQIPSWKTSSYVPDQEIPHTVKKRKCRNRRHQEYAGQSTRTYILICCLTSF